VTRFRKISLAFFSTIVLVILCAQCFGQSYLVSSYCINKKCHDQKTSIVIHPKTVSILYHKTWQDTIRREHYEIESGTGKVWKIKAEGYTFFVYDYKLMNQVVMEKKYRDSTAFIVYNYRRCKD
jgi:hypothetical protein